MPSKRIPFAGVRKAITQRLKPGFHEALPVALMLEYSADRLIEHRKTFQGKTSYTAYGVKAAALALREMPEINVTLEEGELIYHDDVNIAVAVHTSRGLRAPVVKDADRKTLIEITNIIDEYAEKGKSGEITLAQQSGHSFTVTNLGMMEITYFTPIINPPDTAILAMGAIKPRAVIENSQWRLANVGHLTLVFDHRVIDGVPAASFLLTIKKLLESPEKLE